MIQFQIGPTSVEVHNLPDITLTSEEKAHNDGLIEKYVAERHRFDDIVAFAKYADGWRCPDCLSISGVFYEMDEYDGDGFYATYVSVMTETEMRLGWNMMYNRYSQSPCVNKITVQELCSTRNDFQYKSKMPKELTSEAKNITEQ